MVYVVVHTVEDTEPKTDMVLYIMDMSVEIEKQKLMIVKTNQLIKNCLKT